MTTMNKIECNIPLPAPVTFVIERLHSAGFEAYAVGGAVRDHVMGKMPGDYDVTTSATPDEMLSVFELERVVETGLKHGTLTVVKDGMNIETTTYRIDGSYADGRHPDSVKFTSQLSEDLCRRDFTINAMAYSTDGYLIDLYGGKDDIEKKAIRCVGRAKERFTEDGLRILRALRFASVLGFAPDAECAEAIFELSPLLHAISRERIYVEVTKLLLGQASAEILSHFADVIALVMPPLTSEGVVASANLISRLDEYGCTSPSVRYALLFESLCEADAAEVMASLKPSTDEKKAVMSLVKMRGVTVSDSYGVLSLMRDFGDNFPESFAATEYAAGRISRPHAEWIAREAKRAVREECVRSLSQLNVGGADMIGLGLRGEAIGRTLKMLLDAVMRGCVENSAKQLINYAKNNIQE